MTTSFTWDEAKNRSNQKKHDGITFEVAARVFRDPLRLSRQDRFEGGEERWQTLGVVYGVTILFVFFSITEGSPDHKPVEENRSMSARRGTPSERKPYENENR